MDLLTKQMLTVAGTFDAFWEDLTTARQNTPTDRVLAAWDKLSTGDKAEILAKFDIRVTEDTDDRCPNYYYIYTIWTAKGSREIEHGPYSTESAAIEDAIDSLIGESFDELAEVLGVA